MAWQNIGSIARRLAATVIEQRTKAILQTRQTVLHTGRKARAGGSKEISGSTAAVQALPRSTSPWTLAAGREAGRRLEG